MGWKNVLIHLNAIDAGDSFGMNMPTSNAAEQTDLQNLGGFNKWANSRHPYGLQNLEGADN
jgi:hypothetical protein